MLMIMNLGVIGSARFSTTPRLIIELARAGLAKARPAVMPQINFRKCILTCDYNLMTRTKHQTSGRQQKEKRQEQVELL